MDSDDENTNEVMELLSTEPVDRGYSKVLDFVRERMRTLKVENKQLREKVHDMDVSLAILQTAQNYGGASGTLPNEHKMKEVALLLMEAKKAKQEASDFSKVGKAAMYEKLRISKNMLSRERMEKREMKERLKTAFEHIKYIKAQYAQRDMKRMQEREAWQTIVRKIKGEHMREMRRLQDDFGQDSSVKQDRARQLGQFGERVMRELQQLQVHLDLVKKETVDTVQHEAPASAPTGGKLDSSLPAMPSSHNQFFITQR
eukprot:GEMP01029743.1.p1 GENE.GEMP01029743.1~~GEMP01029743.1.p1  ORF type:complete len:258 (+),score=89.36 GEMP01029743.1:1018-1791(+)